MALGEEGRRGGGRRAPRLRTTSWGSDGAPALLPSLSGAFSRGGLGHTRRTFPSTASYIARVGPGLRLAQAGRRREDNFPLQRSPRQPFRVFHSVTSRQATQKWNVGYSSVRRGASQSTSHAAQTSQSTASSGLGRGLLGHAGLMRGRMLHCRGRGSAAGGRAATAIVDDRTTRRCDGLCRPLERSSGICRWRFARKTTRRL